MNSITPKRTRKESLQNKREQGSRHKKRGKKNTQQGLVYTFS